MASPSLPAPFLTRPEFASMALDSVKESYGDKFDFELDDDNFCILFKNKLNPENIGKMYLQNRYQCMLSYGPDINTEKVKEIINDSTDGLTFYSQPAMTVDAADLKQLYPMVKTPQWFQSYQETMGNHGCRETIFQDPIENVELVALTLALNYGKFRRYVTREEVGEWANNFRIEALKEAKANLKGRIAEIGNIKKAWEKPVQVKSKEYRPDMICLTTLLRGVWTRPRVVQ